MSFLKKCNQGNDLRRNTKNRWLVPGDDKHYKEMIQEFINGTACQYIDDLVTEIEEALSQKQPCTCFNSRRHGTISRVKLTLWRNQCLYLR